MSTPISLLDANRDFEDDIWRVLAAIVRGMLCTWRGSDESRKVFERVASWLDERADHVSEKKGGLA
jgi:hypothetical protein